MQDKHSYYQSVEVVSWWTLKIEAIILDMKPSQIDPKTLFMRTSHFKKFRSISAYSI
jgi:hypothetical protein